MRSALRKFINICFILIFLSIPLTVLGFGQNKVQYENFDWHYLQSEHFDIYFYRGSYRLAVFVANEAEEAYRDLKRDFQYEITERVSIILYKSHNDWQQTNVVDVYLSEGIGGVTELYKNRVVVPFEGSYKQLRHVLHHELVHAVMNDMLYGGSIQSLISGQVVPVPLWFSEGIAEYFSVGWDKKADMIVRDATINNTLPPINYLNYYLAYQGGMSVFRYIADKYGHEKVAELLHKIKGSFRFEGAVKSALGIELKELSEDWQKSMRKQHWPELNRREETKDIARALTDHMETRNYLNIAPAISPDGDKLVFLSNMDGKVSIHLMDVLEEKVLETLIEGENDIDFEELHWLSPGMSWSPDGERVTFSAKAGDQDALYIYDVENDDVEQYKFEMDGIFSTAWSPNGREIAFVGNNDDASDIFLFDIENGQVQNITNDAFSDSDPEWSPDGETIVFVSERGEYLSGIPLPDDFLMSEFDYENSDIYMVNRDGTNMRRVTNTSSNESTPVFSEDGSKLMYSFDESGVYNLYIHHLDTDETYPITNLLTGAFQLSVDKDRQTLAFTSFFEGGWDIYTLKNPFEMEPVEIEDTQYVVDLKSGKIIDSIEEEEAVAVEADSVQEKIRVPKATDFSRYVFADLEKRSQKKEVDVELDQEEYKFDDGNYKVHNYRVKFSPDLVYGAAQYNTLWGFQGYTQLAFSDVLGNHKIYIGTNLVFDLRNSYISGQYWYLADRINWGVLGYHYANTIISSFNGLTRYRNYGMSLIASRPFNKFTRLDFSLNWFNVDMEYLQIDAPTQRTSSILPGLQLIHDTSEWGMTGPIDGFRGLLSLVVSPKYSPESLDFATVKFDMRKYYKLASAYSFAFRATGGVSVGGNPQNFFLGGVPYWFNRQYSDGGGLRLDDIRDVYFSEFITPLRGARYYEQTGNHFGLINAEFRFPLIPFMQLGFPPIALGNIMGVMFTDVGSAWTNFYDFRAVGDDGTLDDIVAGYGVGTRIFFLGLLFKYDVAWRFDFGSRNDEIHYFSMGIDF